MRKTIITLATTAILGLAAPLPAMAQDSDEHRGWRHKAHLADRDDFADPARMVEMMTRHLDLDDEQSQAVGNILGAASPEIEALRDRARASRQAVRELDVDDPDYGSHLQNLSTEIGALTSEATLLHGRLRADIYAVLTPEQRERAAEGRGAFFERFRRHRMKGND